MRERDVRKEERRAKVVCERKRAMKGGAERKGRGGQMNRRGVTSHLTHTHTEHSTRVYMVMQAIVLHLLGIVVVISTGPGRLSVRVYALLPTLMANKPTHFLKPF